MTTTTITARPASRTGGLANTLLWADQLMLPAQACADAEPGLGYPLPLTGAGLAAGLSQND